MIETARLSKYYGRVHAVTDVSFSVHPGEIVGLLGPNGAGKTTIMKVLTGYHYPTSGVAFVNGYEVTENPLAVKRCIGYLPENAPLYEDLTVAEYLEFMADTRRLLGARRTEATARVLRLCGLESHVHRPISELSKGYRQRVGLSQAILHDPDILILDEPTTGLDPNQIQEIRLLIREIGREKTVILSTHILQEVEAMCDRVLILNDGRIAAAGTTEEIGRELKGQLVISMELTESTLTGSARAALERSGEIVREEPDPAGQGLRLRVALAEGSAGEDLFRWAVTHKLTIRALVPERYSLEDIFTSLTAGPQTSAEEAPR